MNPYQAKVAIYEAHVDKCRACQQAKFNGNYCIEGYQIIAELEAFFKPVEPTVRAA